MLIFNQLLRQKLQLSLFSLIEKFLDPSSSLWSMQNFKGLSPEWAISCSNSWEMENSDHAFFTTKTGRAPDTSTSRKRGCCSVNIILTEAAPIALGFGDLVVHALGCIQVYKRLSTAHRNLPNQTLLCGTARQSSAWIWLWVAQDGAELCYSLAAVTWDTLLFFMSSSAPVKWGA